MGGTGLYLRAALADLDLPPRLRRASAPAGTPSTRPRGPERAHAWLAERDPEAAAAVHPNDRRRVVRALELAAAGRSLAPEEERLWSEHTRHPTLIFGLELRADELERRIAARTEAMFASGVQDEVRRALARPISQTARQALGLEEVATLPEAEAKERLSQRTRRYAAYQRKWMRRIPGLVSLDADRPPGEVADEILEVARARQRLPAGRAG